MGLPARRACGDRRTEGCDGHERKFSTKGHEHQLTNPGIASRKRHFRIDKLSAVVALGHTTRGACCWTPDTALAKRACLRDIRWPEYLAMDPLPHCAQMKAGLEGWTRTQGK